MTPKRRLNILQADDGSEHVQAAIQWLQDHPPTSENPIMSPIQNVRSGS